MLQMLKMHRSTESIPVIVYIAALDMVREQEGYLVSQGIHVVFKPSDIDHLMANVKELLESHGHFSLKPEEEKRHLPQMLGRLLRRPEFLQSGSKV